MYIGHDFCYVDAAAMCRKVNMNDLIVLFVVYCVVRYENGNDVTG
jgi:hypothetical protein